MYSVEAEIVGLLAIERRVALTQIAMPIEVDAISHGRALRAMIRFVQATPVRTGKAKQGWKLIRLGGGDYAVVNETERKGFAYPGALITGTGDKGQGGALPGFAGHFNQQWHGMSPNSQLRLAWLSAGNEPFTVPTLFRYP